MCALNNMTHSMYYISDILFIVTVQHALSLKNAMSLLGKEISTNAVSRGGYEPTTVPIILGKGAFPLHYISSATYKSIFRISDIRQIDSVK